MIHGLAHVAITVLDFDRMLAFYRDVLGLSVIYTSAHPLGGKKACLKGSDAETVEMISYLKPKPSTGRDRSRTGIHHFGFVVDDIVAESKRLQSQGVEFDGEIAPNPRGDLVQHFWDPEDNRLHLTQRQQAA